MTASGHKTPDSRCRTEIGGQKNRFKFSLSREEKKSNIKKGRGKYLSKELDMRDMTSVKLIYLKGALFLVTGITASVIILVDRPTIKMAALVALAIWAFARFYYFAFYVIEH